jgi:hypothetical protein
MTSRSVLPSAISSLQFNESHNSAVKRYILDCVSGTDLTKTRLSAFTRRCIGPTGSIDLTATAVTQRAGAGTFHTQFSKITQPKIQATCSQIVASICAGVLATFKPAANEFQS